MGSMPQADGATRARAGAGGSAAQRKKGRSVHTATLVWTTGAEGGNHVNSTASRYWKNEIFKVKTFSAL